jgi:hypothetical protein
MIKHLRLKRLVRRLGMRILQLSIRYEDHYQIESKEWYIEYMERMLYFKLFLFKTIRVVHMTTRPFGFVLTDGKTFYHVFAKKDNNHIEAQGRVIKKLKGF